MAKIADPKLDHPLGSNQEPSDNTVDSDSIPPVHREAVNTIADDMRIPVDRVHKIYCIVLEKFSKDARIRDYLPILVTKKVRNLMRKKLEIQNKLDLTGGRQSQRD
ncbi:MAG: DUF3562 domain-containing protein [Dissulfurispiraceae bacterium]